MQHDSLSSSLPTNVFLISTPTFNNYPVCFSTHDGFSLTLSGELLIPRKIVLPDFHRITLEFSNDKNVSLIMKSKI